MSDSKKFRSFLEKGFLISPDAVTLIEKDPQYPKIFYDKLNKGKAQEKLVVVNKDVVDLINKKKELINISWKEFERSRLLFEKGKDKKIYQTFLDLLHYEEKKDKLDKILEEVKKPQEDIKLETTTNLEPTVVILQSYNKKPKKREVQDFVKHLKVRFNKLKKILSNHQDLQNTISINKIRLKNERDPVTILGLVSSKTITKNSNTILTLEDPTGEFKVLISKTREDVAEQAKEIVLDEVIGISGILGKNKEIIFANKVTFPNIPLNKEFKKSPEEVYAAFISDIHIGSKSFLPQSLLKFVNWLNGNINDKKLKEIGKKVKYLFVPGDLVAGIGVYPNQEDDLLIPEIKQQYEELAKYFSKIPKDVKIIISPGNHDATRLSEPQPPLNKDLAKSLWDLPNVVMVSSPSLVNIHSSETFPGFDVIIYHGSSYHYYKSTVEKLKKAHETPQLITEFLLKKRHLAPTHESTVCIPDDEEDPLIIEKIPDIFINGDHHRSGASLFNNINLISCSCFQKKTDYEEKRGYEPDPGVVPILNLKTREVKFLDFNQNE